MFDEQIMTGIGCAEFKNFCPRTTLNKLDLKGPNVDVGSALPSISSKYKKGRCFSLEKQTKRDLKHFIGETNGKYYSIE